jgi:chromosomal replication initiator protein
MADAGSVWKLVLDDLQVSLSPATFTSWIKPLSLLELTPTESGRTIADVRCPSTFHQGIIEQRFYGQIQEVLNRITQQTCELRFTILSPSASKKLTDVGPLFVAQTEQVNDFQWAMQRIGLREDFVFETYAVSSSNEMAHAAAQAVSSDLGKSYNPLFIYGGVGVGKTHLMQAVAIEALRRDPKMKLIFCMGEEFTNEIIDAIQQKTTREFKQRYRQVKGLFIDDIQFIAGKTTVQEEFFHTFNAILKSGGQVVMTSDRPPSEIKMLEARLRSRFEAGLLVDVGNPDFELRAAIVLIKAKQRKLNLSMEMAQTIAGNIESARQIEGFLVKLTTETSLHKRTLSQEMVLSLLGKANNPSQQLNGDSPPPLRPFEVIRGVADHFGINTKLLRGSGRSQKIVIPRHIAMYLLRVDYRLPLMEIGSLFSGRDHTTVMHAVEKITQQLQDVETLRLDIGEVRKHLYAH